MLGSGSWICLATSFCAQVSWLVAVGPANPKGLRCRLQVLGRGSWICLATIFCAQVSWFVALGPPPATIFFAQVSWLVTVGPANPKGLGCRL